LLAATPWSKYGILNVLSGCNMTPLRVIVDEYPPNLHGLVTGAD
jgi:hypothetical protein